MTVYSFNLYTALFVNDPASKYCGVLNVFLRLERLGKKYVRKVFLKVCIDTVFHGLPEHFGLSRVCEELGRNNVVNNGETRSGHGRGFRHNCARKRKIKR